MDEYAAGGFVRSDKLWIHGSRDVEFVRRLTNGITSRPQIEVDEKKRTALAKAIMEAIKAEGQSYEMP